jgi:cytochrome c-type biogenesis protein CcmH/NrfG
MSQNYKIVGMLERIDEQSMNLAPATTYATTQEAASLIQELGEALEPFAGDAENWDEMGDTRPLENDGISKLTVADLRRARAILSKLNEA